MKKLKQLFFNGSLQKGESIVFEKDLTKRLNKVLRLAIGSNIALFNGKDGLFKVEITSANCSTAKVLEKITELEQNSNLTIIQAMVKKDAMDRVFRQSTELGVAAVQPVITEFCVVDKLNTERVESLLIEASEQCERLTIPQLKPIQPLKKVIQNFNGTIFWADESGKGKWGSLKPKSGDAILIGPEGGFSEKEREFLQQQSNVKPIGLGKTILRADTAACVAIGLFNEKI